MRKLTKFNIRNILIIFSLISFFILIENNETKAQCFASPGNPIAGSANVGILQPRIIRAVGFYRYSFSDQYYRESTPIDYNFPAAVSNANYNFVGFNIGRGMTKKFSLELEAGYFINKTQRYRHFEDFSRGYGFSNAVISGKFNIFKNVVKKTEVSVSAGAKLPFTTKPQIVDGVTLDIDLQPSTGNFGTIIQALFVKEVEGPSLRFIAIGRYEKNFNENQLGYKFGDAFVSSLYISKHLANKYTEITKDITLILQIRHEYRMKNLRFGEEVYASGNNILFLAPQINYNYNMVWNFSLIYDVPVYRYYNGTQLGTSHSIAFSVTRDFGFGI
ncbi:MAG: hypothetical protein C0596_11310 [Marinilabiliales bacterium]|nr:MAG: hypothetical protein C0596_11310 [Marinilabiliales bacterium]